MKTLRAYIRRSVYENDDPTRSPARQRETIERWVARNGPYRLAWYEDLDISGRYETNRPGWQSLLADLNPAADHGLIVEAIDRSHRNVREFLAFYDDHLAPAGLTLISATQNLDMSTTDGRAMASVIMTFAEMESRKASDRQRGHTAYLRDVEKRHIGRDPFGVDRHPTTKHLLPSARLYYLLPTGQAVEADEPPPQAEPRRYYDALAACFTLFAPGRLSYLDTADALNAAGWRYWGRSHHAPAPFTFRTVHSIVRRWAIYAGLNAGHPPILPVDLCRQVAAAIHSRATVRNPANLRRPERLYLLSRLVHCAECGQGLVGQKMPNHRGGYYYYYRHSVYYAGCAAKKLIPAEEIERVVLDRVQAFGQNYLPDILNRLRQALHESRRPAAPSAGQSRLAQAETEMERLIDLEIRGLLTPEQFIKRQIPLAAEIERLKNETASVSPAALATLQQNLLILSDNLSILSTADPHLQREIVRSLIRRVEVRGPVIERIDSEPWAVGL